MGLRKTVAAVVVLAGLVAFLYYYEYKGEAGRERAEEERSRPLSFESGAMTSIKIDRPGGIALAIVRRDDAWHLAAPIATRADDRTIDTILNDLRSLQIERTLERIGAAERGTFGLEKPAVRVVLTGAAAVASGDTGGPPGEGDLALDIGGPVPVSGGRYAARPGQDDVLLIEGSLTTILEASADSLRQKKLIGIDSWKIRLLTMRNQGGSVELEKTGDSWRLTAPVTVPADDARVEPILAALAAAEATGFADEAPGQEQLASYGLTPESGAIDVEVTGEGTAARAVVGRATAEGASWARRADMDAVMILAASLRENVASALAAPETLRDPRPARFNRFALSGLKVVEGRGSKRTLTLIKDATSSWHLGSDEGTTLPSERVNAILDALETLVADRWASAPDRNRMQEATLSIVLTENAPAAGEESVEPLELTVWTPEGMPATKEATIGSSIASVRYVVPGSGVAKLFDAVARLEEPLPEPDEPPAGTASPAPPADAAKEELP